MLEFSKASSVNDICPHEGVFGGHVASFWLVENMYFDLNWSLQRKRMRRWVSGVIKNDIRELIEDFVD